MMDQHDKLLKHGIALHVGIEPVAGSVLWAKVWWTNKNSKVVAGWFLDAVQSLGGKQFLKSIYKLALRTLHSPQRCLFTRRAIPERKILGSATHKQQ